LVEFVKSIALRTLSVEANAGNKTNENVKYKKAKPKKTQNNCEKKEKMSNCGI
jgi:hypothetical protein